LGSSLSPSLKAKIELHQDTVEVPHLKEEVLVGLPEGGDGGEAVDVAEHLWLGLQQSGAQDASLEAGRHSG
jgi:hypothetical protein